MNAESLECDKRADSKMDWCEDTELFGVGPRASCVGCIGRRRNTANNLNMDPRRDWEFRRSDPSGWASDACEAPRGVQYASVNQSNVGGID